MADILNIELRFDGTDVGASRAIENTVSNLRHLQTVSDATGTSVGNIFRQMAEGAAQFLGQRVIETIVDNIGRIKDATIGAATDFEATISGVRAVSGATVTQMQELQQLALDLGRDTVFTSHEAAAGIEALVKGGVSIADIMGGAAKSTLSLAAAGGIDLVQASTIAANVLAQFNLKGKDMAHVADLIAGAANASAIDVGQFAYSMQQSGAIAATVGFRFDDLAQAIAVMGESGIVGADAGTSLKAMMLALQPATVVTKNLMKELGIVTEDGSNRFFDAQGKVKSMVDVAGVLQTALKGLTDQQRIQTLETLFGSDAIRAAAVFTKAGSEGFTRMADSMKKVTAEEVATQRLDNLKGALEQLNGSIETVGVTIGLAFTPLLKDLANAITPLVNSLLPSLDAAAERLAATIESTGKRIGTFITSNRAQWQQWATTLQGIWTALTTTVRNVFTPLVTIVQLLWTQISTYVTSNWRLVEVTIQRGVGTVVGWFRQHQQELTTIWNALWYTVGITAQVALGTVVNLVQGGLRILNGDFRGGVELIRGSWEGLWRTIPAIVTNALPAVIAALQTASGAMRELTTGAWNAIIAIIAAAMRTSELQVRTQIAAMANTIGTAWQTVQTATATAWQAILTTITGLIGQLPTQLQTPFQAVGAAFSAWGANLLSIAQPLWGAVQAFLVGNTYETASLLRVAWQAAGIALGNLWSGLQETARALWAAIQVAWTTGTTLVQAVQGAWAATLRGDFTGLTTALSTLWDGLTQRLSEAWTTLWTALVAAVEARWPGVPALISAGWALIRSVTQAGATFLTTTVPAALTTVAQAAQTAWPGFQQAATVAWTALQLAWETVLRPAWEALSTKAAEILTWAVANWPTWQAALTTAWTTVQGIWQTILQPTFQALFEKASEIVAWAIEHWPTFQEALNVAWTAIQGFWTTILQPALQGLYDLAAKVVAWALENWPTFQSAIDTAWKFVKARWEDTLKPAWDAALALMTRVMEWARDTGMPALQLAIEQAWAAIKKAWDEVLDPAFQTGWELIQKVVDWVQTTGAPFMQNAITGAWNAIKTAWETVLNPAFQTGWELIQRVVKWVQEEGMPHMQDAVSLAWTTIQNLWNTILSKTFVDAWGLIQRFVEWARDDGMPMLSGAVNVAWTFIQNLWANVLWPALQGALDKMGEIKDWAVAHWPEIQTIIGTAWTGIQNFWATILWPALNDLLGMFGTLFEWVVANWPAMQTTITSALQAIGLKAWEIAPYLSGSLAGAMNFAKQEYTLFLLELEKREVYGDLEIIWKRLASDVLPALARAFNGTATAAGESGAVGPGQGMGAAVKFLTTQLKMMVTGVADAFDVFSYFLNMIVQVAKAIGSVGGAISALMRGDFTELGKQAAGIGASLGNLVLETGNLFNRWSARNVQRMTDVAQLMGAMNGQQANYVNDAVARYVAGTGATGPGPTSYGGMTPGTNRTVPDNVGPTTGGFPTQGGTMPPVGGGMGSNWVSPNSGGYGGGTSPPVGGSGSGSTYHPPPVIDSGYAGGFGPPVQPPGPMGPPGGGDIQNPAYTLHPGARGSMRFGIDNTSDEGFYITARPFATAAALRSGMGIEMAPWLVAIAANESNFGLSATFGGVKANPAIAGPIRGDAAALAAAGIVREKTWEADPSQFMFGEVIGPAAGGGYEGYDYFRVEGDPVGAFMGFPNFLRDNSNYRGSLAQYAQDHDPLNLIYNVNMAGYATNKGQIPGRAAWWREVQSQRNSVPYAMGGWITEPVLGQGMHSGRTYSFGEREAEYVTPHSQWNGGGSGVDPERLLQLAIQLVEQVVARARPVTFQVPAEITGTELLRKLQDATAHYSG